MIRQAPHFGQPLTSPSQIANAALSLDVSVCAHQSARGTRVSRDTRRQAWTQLPIPRSDREALPDGVELYQSLIDAFLDGNPDLVVAAASGDLSRLAELGLPESKAAQLVEHRLSANLAVEDVSHGKIAALEAQQAPRCGAAQQQGLAVG